MNQWKTERDGAVFLWGKTSRKWHVLRGQPWVNPPLRLSELDPRNEDGLTEDGGRRGKRRAITCCLHVIIRIIYFLALRGRYKEYRLPLSKWPLCGALISSRNLFFKPPLMAFNGDPVFTKSLKKLLISCTHIFDRELIFCFLIDVRNNDKF